ncbi:hypothetical protein RRG08_003268 [Elysia crispata]|uniref:Uncharacterized protein n=1 Tax=Elysia crispata TaxID=231223 RepID=A0AAE1AUU9_9GAST|nr:hypothetical protein RRG08_003268 [Elysia crispata]
MAHCLSHAWVIVTCGSAMMTALISTERCVSVVFPLKVKTLLTRRRSLFLTLAVVAYHVIFTIVLYSDTGPPYDAHPQKLSFYYFSLYVIPSTSCFFIVVLTTIFLVVKLRTNVKRAHSNFNWQLFSPIVNNEIENSSFQRLESLYFFTPFGQCNWQDMAPSTPHICFRWKLLKIVHVTHCFTSARKAKWIVIQFGSYIFFCRPTKSLSVLASP